MIRYSTTRFHNGKKVKAGDPVEGTQRQIDRLLDCGQAYDDGQDAPDETNTVKELKAYMDSEGIYFNSSMNKEELLQQIDDFKRNSDISE